MNQGISFGFDVSDFQDTLRKYLAVTQKTLPEALNQKMFFILRGASRLTPKTSREIIERELKVTGYAQKVYVRGKKKGQINERGKLGRVQTSSPLIYKIINARRGRAGKPGLFGSEMRSAAAKLLAKRFRSVGTLKAGWLGAIRKLAPLVGDSSRDAESGASSIIKGRSKAIPAKSEWSPHVEIEYLTNSFSKEHRPYIDARIQQALAIAFNDEKRSMEEYIIKKLQGKIDAIPAKRSISVDEAKAKIMAMLKP